MAIRATLHALDNQELICANCIKRYGENDAATQNFRAARGCETPVSPSPFEIERLTFSRCVGNYVDLGLMVWIQAADRYAQGTMPFEGAFMSQPAKAIELFGMITAWRSQQQERAVKAHEARMEKRARQSRHN